MVLRSSATINLSFGLLNITGSLYPITSERVQAGGAKTAKTVSCCPTCHEQDATVTKTNRAYVCPAGHGPFGERELLKAVGPAKALVIISDAETLKEAKQTAADEGGPGLTCRLVSYSADEIQDALVPIGTPYVFHPSAASDAYQLYVQKIDTHGRFATEGDDVMLLGEVQIRKGAPSKLVTLRTRNGQLLVQEMSRPEDVNVDIPTVAPTTVEDAWVEQFTTILSLTRKDHFDANEYRNKVSDAMASFIESSLSEGDVLPLAPISDITPITSAPSVADQLAAMVAAAKSA